MKIAYIAHPISGDVQGNIEAILRIIKYINLNEPETVPFAPYLPDCIAMDDSIPEQRERGIRNGIELFEREFIDELRIYGNRISRGIEAEIELAKRFNIPVIDLRNEKI